MNNAVQRNNIFSELNEYVSGIKKLISASAAATYIIYNDRTVNEWYSGHHENTLNSREVDDKSQFNVASIRKTYLGFAVSMALYEGKIKSIDDFVFEYISELDEEILGHTTIRHLLTHTHGLQSYDIRGFPPGTDWEYNNVGVNILINIIQNLYEKPLAHVLEEQVFSPCGLTETHWRKEKTEKLVWRNKQYDGDEGTESNLFVSTRELAFWGYLHLQKGFIKGNQIIPRKVFEQGTSIVSPHNLERHLPRNGFFWFVQDIPRSLSELGDNLPEGSFQTLGITGCACLVIPKYKTVAVRMYNQTEPNPNTYDYLKDIKTFGNMVIKCVQELKP